MGQSKKKPVVKNVAPVKEIIVLNEIEKSELVEEPVSRFVWVDPSPGLHDRLNILLSRRNLTLHELIVPENLEISEEDFAKKIRLWVGFSGGSELSDDVWLKVLGKLER
jgi:hypothetical protein